MDFGTLLILLVASVLATMACGGLAPRERRFAMVSFALHIVSSVGQWALNEFYYEAQGDIVGNRNAGVNLARLMGDDIARYVPEVVKLALHFDPSLPFEVTGNGSATGTMSAIAAFLIAFAGSSLLTMYFFASFCSWFGQLCMYRVARAELEPRDHTAAMIGLLLVPSVVAWGAVFTKESLVIAFLGILIRSAWSVLRKSKPSSLLGLVFGGIGVAVLKPYTLFAFVAAFPAFIYADRAWRTASTVRIRPVYLLLAAAIAIVGLAGMSRLFPQFAPDKVAETIAWNQGNWDAGSYGGAGGGSYVEIGSGEATTMTQQLTFAPIAFVNSFFRPFFFEARGLPMFGAALESTVLTVLVLQLLGAGGRKTVREAILRTPAIVFSIAFCPIFGIAVGLATSNLGTLSRYRMPMMPFYVTTVLILRARARQAVLSAASVRPALRPAVRRMPR